MQTLEKFISLGHTLAQFGTDEPSQRVLQRAVAENEWFTRRDVITAVRAIAQDMLTPQNLERWLALYPTRPVAVPRQVLVFMAGNIPAVGFADLLCVLAAGHRALVKYSSRDRALMEYIVQLLNEDFDIREYVPESHKPELLLAMGSDSTARILEERFGGIPRLVRSTRTSVAVLDGRESESELTALCCDVGSFDGRGCRSVSHLLVPEEYDFKPLIEVLSRMEVSDKWRAIYTHNRAMAVMMGAEFMDCGVVTLSAGDQPSMSISELRYTTYGSATELADWIAERDSTIQCIVSHSFEHPRSVPFGRAQHPSLTDYPDGMDTMSWLLSY
ncbi:MAG: aldehyde dehydrogenase [Rikenellaceae bacterium]|nr:aldehyde dehydrogenase [Rikenellaceae bacterium]